MMRTLFILLFCCPLALMATPPNDSKKEDKISDAFKTDVDKMFQLSPDELRYIRSRMDEKEKADIEPVNLPLPMTSSVPIDLSPGGDIPTLHLYVHHTSTAVFLDSTGQPWPMKNNPDKSYDAFNITSPQDHILTISSEEKYTQGNLSLNFEGLNVPVVILLKVGDGVVDLRKEFHFPRPGPKAKAVHKTPPIKNDIMLSILDNVPPKSARELRTLGADLSTKVWEHNGYYYVRTRALLLLPAPLASSTSSDGTKIYKSHKMPSLAMSIDGQQTSVRVFEN